MTGHATPTAAQPEQSQEMTREESERRQSLWWYLLMTGLLLLAAETVISNHLSRKRKVPVICSCHRRAFRSVRQQENRRMDPRTELVDVIRRVRNRWRLRLALRGAVVVAAGTVLALLLSASGLESFRFSAPAIITFRIIIVAVFVGLLLYGLVWPLRRARHRRPGRDVSRGMRSDARSRASSARSKRRRAAVRRRTRRGWSTSWSSRRSTSAASLEHGRAIERTAVQRHAGALAAIAALVALVLAFGPAYLRHGLSALLMLPQRGSIHAA